MMKIAICNENVALANDMELYINQMKEKYHLNISVKVYTESLKLYRSLINGTRYDVIYLGVKMMFVDGIELAYYIRENYPHVEIVFLTEQEDFTLEIFNVQPFQCMLLPINWDKLRYDLLKITEHYATNDKFFYYSFNKVQYQISIREIVYFKSNLRTCDMVCVDDFLGTFTSKLDEVELQMDAWKQHFVRIHQSYLVQLRYIRSIQKQGIELYDGRKLPISGERWDDVSNQYANYQEYERHRYEGECSKFDRKTMIMSR